MKANNQRRCILVAEDDAGMRKSLKALLEASGYHAVTAENGKIAEYLLKIGTFDAVIADLLMPGVNGLELLKLVKSTKPIPFFLMTGMAGLDEAKEALD